MIDPVKPVATDSSLNPFIWAGINGGGIRHSAVKASVKYGKLRDWAKQPLYDIDAFHFSANMKWSKWSDGFDGRAYRGRQRNGFVKMWAAVHHAVSDGIDLCRSAD